MSIHDLALKYNYSVPRYTSFPTILDWKENISFDEWDDKFSGISSGVGSVYIHIPFCAKLCSFCACNKVLMNGYDAVEGYINKLEEEILHYTKGGQIKVSQMHFGGGTPTSVKPRDMDRLFAMLAKYFDYQEGCEKSLEAHPVYTTKEHVDVLAKWGFTRLSYGIQDFDSRVQKAINRPQDIDWIYEITAYTRKVGIKEINYDFVYGLPCQTFLCINNIIKEVGFLKPNRIAFYSYANVPWKVNSQKKYENMFLPDPQTKIQMLMNAKDGFEKFGYKYIGLDHFALSGDDITDPAKIYRNFMGYTTSVSDYLIGFGVSSISETDFGYKQNSKSLKQYMENPLGVQKTHAISDKERRIKRAIIEVMTKLSSDVSDLKILDERLQMLQKDELCVLENGVLKVYDKGRPFLRHIASVIDPFNLSTKENTFSTGI